MSEESDLERTEEASPKRLEEARKEGDVPRSRELSTCTVLLAAGGALWAMGGSLVKQLNQMLTHGLTLNRETIYDFNVLAEKIARQDIQNMFPKKLDLVNDPLPIQKFNILYSLMTLHHIPEVENILQKFFDVLLPDGWIAISDLDAEDGSFHGVEQQHVHKGFERNALQKQVETAGFVDVHFFTVFHMTKTVGDGIRNFPIFLMIARKPNIHL